MKKILSALLAVTLMLGLLAGCGTSAAPASAAPTAAPEATAEPTAQIEPLNVLLLVPAVGDKSYFDGAAMAMDELKSMYSNVTTETVAMGRDDVTVYPQFFTDACESGDYDLIVTGGGECTEALVAAATAYPDQLFFDFDYQDTYNNDLANIYGVYYKSYDMGYLAGYLASLITVSDMSGANADKKVGAVLGMDIPDINDFVGSFCQACIDMGVNADIEYANSFSDPDAAYAVAKVMYDAGCDVIWQVAGSAGAGVFKAAAETGHYSFGVDVDQTQTIEDAASVATIVTSFGKNYAGVIVNAVELLMAGTYPGGTCELLGLKENGVILTDNEQYESMVPQEIRDSLTVMYDKVNSGEIVPYSVLENPDGWADIKAQAAAIEG